MFQRIVRVSIALIAVSSLVAASAPQVGAASTAVPITQIVAGTHHTCALTSGGGVKCWGYNGDGELGNGSHANSGSPVGSRVLRAERPRSPPAASTPVP